MHSTMECLLPEPASVISARRTIGALPLDRTRMNLAKLAVSELVANCLEHAGLHERDRIDVRAMLSEDGRLRVEVSDPGPGPDLGTSTGIGLRAVERVADRWGVRRGPAHSCVWFELDDAALL